ncbi:Lrp/AsnC family transcriptional regulator [Hyphococcus sp.]|uniref:Lrp/AsnC family transcriptional regulator n=1 Tax=Hyphococcus sp. TaxID=2038636 RepID=UPI003CCB9E31
MKDDLDKADLKLLRVLQQQCRASSQDLAEETAMSPATCWRRMKALEENGYIREYSAKLDRRALGFTLSAFVHVSIDRRYSEVVEDVAVEIAKRPEVLECCATTGDSDFTLRVVARDIEDYDNFLENFLFRLPGVGQVRSSIVLREIKHTSELPI